MSSSTLLAREESNITLFSPHSAISDVIDAFAVCACDRAIAASVSPERAFHKSKSSHNVTSSKPATAFLTFTQAESASTHRAGRTEPSPGSLTSRGPISTCLHSLLPQHLPLPPLSTLLAVLLRHSFWIICPPDLAQRHRHAALLLPLIVIPHLWGTPASLLHHEEHLQSCLYTKPLQSPRTHSSAEQ